MGDLTVFAQLRLAEAALEIERKTLPCGHRASEVAYGECTICGFHRALEMAEAQVATLQAEVERLQEALERYVAKFGNCGDVYVQAKSALAAREVGRG